MNFETAMRNLPCNNNRAGIQHDDRVAYRKGHVDSSNAAAAVAKVADLELARLNSMVGNRVQSEYDELRAYLAGAAPAMLRAFDGVRAKAAAAQEPVSEPDEDRRTRYERATA